MRSLRKVIAIIEPHQMRQAALERAFALNLSGSRTKSKNKIEIMALLPVFDEHWDRKINADADIKNQDEMIKKLILKKEKWLDSFLSIHALGFDIKRKVIWSKSLGKDILDVAKEYGADGIIKTADDHGLLDGVIFTPLDMQLLRHSHIPVLIAKNHIWHPTGVIAVALNIADHDDVQTRLLNMRLLREAQELSRITKCEIHILNAISPLMPPVTMDISGMMPESISENRLKDCCRSVLSFAQRHRIKAEYCHIREGKVEDVIPALCQELKPTTLFIGTAARDGLAVALLGNICEKVIDSLNCDVAVITPKAVAHKIPFATGDDGKKGVF